MDRVPISDCSLLNCLSSLWCILVLEIEGVPTHELIGLDGLSVRERILGALSKDFGLISNKIIDPSEYVLFASNCLVKAVQILIPK